MPAQGSAAAAPEQGGDSKAGSGGPGGSRRSGMPRWVLWFMLITAVAILGGIVWAIVLMIADARTAPADADATGDMHALQVVEGMCLENVPQDGAIATVTVVPCDTPHRAQVVAQMRLPLEIYPGEAEILDWVEDFCEPRIPYAVRAESGWTSWIPSSDSWTRGDRSISCVVVTDDPTEESLLDDAPEDDDSDQDGQST